MAVSQVKSTLFISLLVSVSLFTGLGLSSSFLKGEPNKWVAVGHRVNLICRFSLQQRPLPDMTVFWDYQSGSKNQMILSYSTKKLLLNAEYQDRVGFVHRMPNSDVSISLNSTKLSDSGLYRCVVTISDLKLMDVSATNLSVLVPPSTPKCSVKGNQHLGSNVTLSCVSRNGDPKPTYTWERKSPKPQSFFFPSHNADKGTLTLTNISKEMNGFYSCESANKAGNAMCVIRMDVTNPVRLRMIVGAVIGLIVGICVVLLAVACFYMYRRRKKAEKEEDRANEIKEDAQPPTGSTWSKNNNSSMMSKTGTLSSVTSTLPSHKPVPSVPASDTASSITALGNDPHHHPRHPHHHHRAPNTDRQHSPSSRSPSAKSTALHPPAASASAGPHPPRWQNGAQPQTGPREASALPSVTPSNLSRMGAVPVMVPAQNQAGSLV